MNKTFTYSQLTLISEGRFPIHHLDTAGLEFKSPNLFLREKKVFQKLFRSCKFIVWDEYTTTHKHALEAIDRMVRDIINKDKQLGGHTLILSGDFRQILPVVERGTKTDHINSCLKTSVMWINIRLMQLTKNMRVFLSNNQDTATFENYLLYIGNGMTQKNNGMDIITLGNIMENKNELISTIYKNVEDNYLDDNWLCERCILTPKNYNVYIINHNLLYKFPIEMKVYRSIDRVQKKKSCRLSHRIFEFH